MTKERREELRRFTEQWLDAVWDCVPNAPEIDAAELRSLLDADERLEAVRAECRNERYPDPGANYTAMAVNDVYDDILTIAEEPKERGRYDRLMDWVLDSKHGLLIWHLGAALVGLILAVACFM